MYDITKQFEEFENAMIETGGELTPDLEKQFEELLSVSKDKVKGYIAIIREKTAFAKAVDAEVKRLQAKKKTVENTAKALKDRLLAGMQAMGFDKFETSIGRAQIQSTGKTTLTIHCETLKLPETCYNSVTSFQPNKEAIRQMIEDGDGEYLKGEDEDGNPITLAQLNPPSEFIRIY